MVYAFSSLWKAQNECEEQQDIRPMSDLKLQGYRLRGNSSLSLLHLFGPAWSARVSEFMAAGFRGLGVQGLAASNFL